MNGSPATCSENRVHRAHSTHRSRSSSTSLDSGIGLGKVRLTPSKRDSARPVDIAWFCSGHSPPLSHTGQSSGWLIRSSSITPRWAFSAIGEVIWVRTTMPSVAVVVQEARGFRWPSTSTRHCLHAPTGSSRGWSQNLGICTPISSAARITKVPLGTLSSTPSMVIVTRSRAAEPPDAGLLSTAVIAHLRSSEHLLTRTGLLAPDRTGSRRVRHGPRTRHGNI